MKDKFKRFIKIVIRILCIVFVIFVSLFCFSIKWMLKTWNNLTMDEVIFHLTTPLEGTNNDMIFEYICQAVVPSLIIFILFLLMSFVLRKKNWFSRLYIGCTAVSFMIFAFVGKYAWDSLKIGQYITSQNTESTFIENYYVNPQNINIKFPEKKRNLIYIYLESMETTYADKKNGGAFDHNVISELTSLAQNYEDFSGTNSEINGAYVPVGASWTMGAMFAHTSGLPLKVSIDGNDMDTQTSFFSGIDTLGDILDGEGYSQTLLIGSDATFGGRRLYFTEHKNYEMMDYEYAKENKLIPENYKVWWGYEDDKLFEYAKNKLSDLSSSSKPFNLTMLTVDTHFEDGYVCDDCPDTYGDNQYANVMACSSKKVADFISWVQKQDFYDNTTIVIAGDHLTMDKDFCESIDSAYQRKTYTSFINSSCDLKTDKNRIYTTFDLFPTTLAAMGAEIEGDQLGLGTNLFSKTVTLAERFGIEKLDYELSGKSSFLEQLANIDENTEEMVVRKENRRPNVKVKLNKKTDDIYTIYINDFSAINEDVLSVHVLIYSDEKQTSKYSVTLNQVNDEGAYSAEINLKEIIGDKQKECYIRPIVVGTSGAEYECRLKRKQIK